MTECSLSPYQLTGNINDFYEIMNASKTLDLNFGNMDSKVTFDIPTDVNFNTDKVNSELDNITKYINNDLEKYLSCLANKSENEIFDSLKNTIPQLKNLLELIPKINNLIPQIEKLHKFSPDSEIVSAFFDKILNTIRTIDKYIAILITSLIIIISLIILLLAISTVSLISLFVKPVTYKYVIIVIIVYCILTFILASVIKNYVENQLNDVIANRIILLRNEINQLVELIRTEVNVGVDFVNQGIDQANSGVNINSSGVP